MVVRATRTGKEVGTGHAERRTEACCSRQGTPRHDPDAGTTAAGRPGAGVTAPGQRCALQTGQQAWQQRRSSDDPRGRPLRAASALSAFTAEFHTHEL